MSKIKMFAELVLSSTQVNDGTASGDVGVVRRTPELWVFSPKGFDGRDPLLLHERRGKGCRRAGVFIHLHDLLCLKSRGIRAFRFLWQSFKQICSNLRKAGQQLNSYLLKKTLMLPPM